MRNVEFLNLPKLDVDVRESLRTIRSNIGFYGKDMKVVMICSTMPNEGKSTVVFNLARSLTQDAKKVLVIDTDMRKSEMVEHLRAVPTEGRICGLSHYLSDQCTMEDAIYSTSVAGLDFVFAGPLTAIATELLTKQPFEELMAYARENYDYVIVDSAPIGLVIDAAVIARHCDGVVMVIEQGQVGRYKIGTSVKQLEAAGVTILGAVLNKVKRKGIINSIRYKKYYDDYYKKNYHIYQDVADF